MVNHKTTGSIDPGEAVRLIREYFNETSNAELARDLRAWNVPELIDYFEIPEDDETKPTPRSA